MTHCIDQLIKSCRGDLAVPVPCCVTIEWLGVAPIRSIIKGDEHAEAGPAEVTQARHSRDRPQIELDRLIAAIRARVHPQLAAPQTSEVQSHIAAAASMDGLRI